MKRPRGSPLACVGAGRVARTLLPALAAKGYAVDTVVARRAAAARSLARRLPGARASVALARVASASTILLAVPDGAIQEIAGRLAAAAGPRLPGRVVLHHAGSLGPEILQPLARVGAATGVFHPLQCIGGPPGSARSLPGSRALIDGSAPARGVARALARALEMVPLRFPAPLRPAQRRAYHAAASLVSNDLVALLALGVRLLEETGLDRRAALAALAPLARGTLQQAERSGLHGALSGPVVRGDAATVDAQLTALRRVGTDAVETHRLLSRLLLDAALAEGTELPAGAERRLRRLLRPHPIGRIRKPTV